MPTKQQAVRDHTCRVLLIGVAGEFCRPRELEKPCDDQSYPMDLLVDERKVGCGRFIDAPEILPQDVEITLNDRDRVVDLVGNAGRNLTDRRKFARRSKLLCRGGQPFVSYLKLSCSRLNALVEIICPFSQFTVSLLNLIEQRIKVVRNHAYLIGGWPKSRPGIEIAALDETDCFHYLFKGLEDAASPPQEYWHADSCCEKERRHHEKERRQLCKPKWLFEEANVEHADSPAATINDRLVGGNIPVVHNKCPVEPYPPLPQYGVSDLLRHACP